MLRRLISAAAIVSLQIAAISAPFVHAHEDEHPTAHHAGQGVHAHVGGHIAVPHAVNDGVHPGVHDGEPAGPHVEVPEHDRATYLAPFVAVGARAADVLPAVAHRIFELTTPVAAYAHRSTALLPGHDPPLAAALSPRAPPSSPAL